MSTTRYEDELAALSGHTHGRNAQLVRIALLGLAANRDPAAICEEIIVSGGEPRLTDAEVKRAVEKALKIRGKNVRFTPRSAAKRTEKRKPTEKQKGFVRKLIEAGGEKSSSRDLQALSKGGDFLEKVLEADALYFFGDPYQKRTRDRLMTPDELRARLVQGGKLPTHFIPNPFTGQSALNEAGEESYCLDSLIAQKTLALIEFDAMPLEVQAAFWVGAITTGLLPVVSLVYSGGKSIHGLIKLKPTDWAGQWRNIEELLASDADPAFRCDIACKNAGRMTRFPEALRPDTNRRQHLLYLA